MRRKPLPLRRTNRRVGIFKNAVQQWAAFFLYARRVRQLSNFSLRANWNIPVFMLGGSPLAVLVASCQSRRISVLLIRPNESILC